MRFGPVPPRAAVGAILAHSEDLGDRRLRKGKRLTEEDTAALAAAGRRQVVVARLEPGDLHEDTAADRLAAAICGDGIAPQGPSATGRVNLRAAGPGVLVADSARVGALNRVDPMLTLATLPPFRRLAASEMVGTVKVISYGVAADSVARAEAAGQGALRLARPVLATATLIETRVGPDTPPDKGRRAMRARLAALGLSLSPRVVVAHDTDAVAEALAAAQGELVLILTASATSDIHDTAPEGLRRAGGTVAQFGMPVDPGNLLFLGAVSGRPVIGLPGCARSPALNGADWVLDRVACGLPVGPEEIAAMGLGGLLKESPARGRPRAD
ncbi:molybdopterin-binding protein [Salibaculum halophilum]|uniref:molybdopterin-binding protein n=1 Tax=Salibaculum halophilum TaxID=1914408 RepID=UPI000A0FE851|nr:molybdopterin-binding protein [Salibaculum halophilum]